MLKVFTDKFNYMPLVSVRSGAKMSMPGMLDTILNVGITVDTLPFWQEKIGTACAENSFARLVEMYGGVVKNVARKHLADKHSTKALQFYASATGEAFPTTPEQQIINSIEAVFKSWGNARAVTYRNLNKIPHDLGTAVVLQAMVFGNMGETSCTGVMFSRHPSNGDTGVEGE